VTEDVVATISPQQQRLKTGDSVIVRSPVPSDAVALLENVRSVLAEGEFVVTCPDEFTLTEDEERDWIRQYAEAPGKVAVVAEASHQIVGVLSAESFQRKRLAHRATVHISVKKEWRERGIGSVLLQAVVDWAVTHPFIEQLVLSVFATNVRAIGLYRKFGFVKEGRQPQEVKLGPGQYVDNILMHRFVKTIVAPQGEMIR
jgi:RimJ/RimL family protein N-acetyltransferase